MNMNPSSLKQLVGFFRYRDVSDSQWQNFIDKGIVSDRLIKIISFAIIENRKLSERELAIFCSKTAEINDMIIQVSKKEFNDGTQRASKEK